MPGSFRETVGAGARLVRRRLHGRLLARRAIGRLARTQNPRAATLARALGAAARGRLSAEEEARIERIEELRHRISASAEEISVVDYGAGTPAACLSAEEMARGRVSTHRLGELAAVASMPPHWALVLFELVRELRPHSCLELGTAVGISSAYQGSALQLNGGGRLLSLEGAPEVAAIAERNLAELGLDSVAVRVGRFRDTLEPALRELAPLEYALVDGHHDRNATIGYFHQLVPHLADDAVLVFDDVDWSRGMRDAWRSIREDTRVSLSVDLFRLGLCVVGATRRPRAHFRIAVA